MRYIITHNNQSKQSEKNMIYFAIVPVVEWLLCWGLIQLQPRSSLGGSGDVSESVFVRPVSELSSHQVFVLVYVCQSHKVIGWRRLCAWVNVGQGRVRGIQSLGRGGFVSESMYVRAESQSHKVIGWRRLCVCVNVGQGGVRGIQSLGRGGCVSECRNVRPMCVIQS